MMSRMLPAEETSAIVIPKATAAIQAPTQVQMMMITVATTAATAVVVAKTVKSLTKETKILPVKARKPATLPTPMPMQTATPIRVVIKDKTSKTNHVRITRATINKMKMMM